MRRWKSKRRNVVVRDERLGKNAPTPGIGCRIGVSTLDEALLVERPPDERGADVSAEGMRRAPLRSPTGRPHAGGTEGPGVGDAVPFLAKSSPRAFASSTQVVTLTDNSPRLVRTTSPVALIQSPSEEPRPAPRSAPSRLTPRRAEAEPVQSRSSANPILSQVLPQHHPDPPR